MHPEDGIESMRAKKEKQVEMMKQKKQWEDGTASQARMDMGSVQGSETLLSVDETRNLFESRLHIQPLHSRR